MKIKLAYDISVLSAEALQSKRKSGIFRVNEETLKQFSTRSDLALSLVNVCGEQKYLSAAVTSGLLNKNVLDLPRFDFDDFFRSRANVNSIYPVVIGAASRDVKDKYFLDSSRVRSLSAKLLLKLLNKFDSYISPLDEKYDIIHSSYHKLPSESITGKAVRFLTVHDLIPVLMPGLVHPGLTKYFRRLLYSINTEKDWVICDSEHTRRELCEYTGMKADRTFVIPLAAADHFRHISDKNVITLVCQRYGIPNERYFLSLATQLDPRKNLDHLIKCFFCLAAEQSDAKVNLVLIGAKRFRTGQTIRHPDFPMNQSKVIFTGFVEDQDLSALYSGATAFIYPSLYEGFGLPPLEAMSCGVPVIASNTTSLPEVIGDAGILVDPTDKDVLCSNMSEVLKSESLRSELKEKGEKRAQRFSWKACADQTVTAYKTALSRA